MNLVCSLPSSYFHPFMMSYAAITMPCVLHVFTMCYHFWWLAYNVLDPPVLYPYQLSYCFSLFSFIFLNSSMTKPSDPINPLLINHKNLDNFKPWLVLSIKHLKSWWYCSKITHECLSHINMNIWPPHLW